jgi:hypothetical protein
VGGAQLAEGGVDAGRPDQHMLALLVAPAANGRSDDVDAEVQRLEALGATRYDHQQERGFDFWVMRDPWGNEFCVLQPNFPELLARRRPWTT